MSIKENVLAIYERVEKSAKKINKNKEDITVVAATKMQDANAVISLKDAGISISGENKVQELLSKYDDVHNTTWHFIGRLQTNKVKYIIDKVDLIHSVDRVDLIKEIDKQAKKINKVQKVLLEVNVAHDENKAGFDITEVDEILELIDFEYKNILVIGLMSILPYYENPSEHKDVYLQLSSVYDRISKENSNFKYLSMGMSNDFEVAIECGANMVRLGTIIFGERNYNL